MVTTLDTLVRDRTDGDLGPLFDSPPMLEHEHHWEGEFAGSHGAAAGCVIRVKARISFYPDLIDGVGRALNISPEFTEGDAAFSLTGSRAGEAVSFQLWFSAEIIAREAFASSGELSADGREMAGEWSVRCFNPEDCGCDGGGGTFRLKRID